VLTHGFVVDGKGKKISKQKGNFSDPYKAIKQNGAELLRLWVAAEDYRGDIRISDEILKRFADMYRKMRNTMRYLLGNLHDFDPNKDLCSPDALEDFDAYGVFLAQQALDKARKAYEDHTFHIVVNGINELCTVDLSAFYLDVIKDRLYCHGKTSAQRRSAQTALYVIARDLFRTMAPVLCFTAEEAWGALPRMEGDTESVHLMCYPQVDEPEQLVELHGYVAKKGEELSSRYETLRDARREVNVALESARRDKIIGSSTEARVSVVVPAEVYSVLSSEGAAKLADLFIVSATEIQQGDSFSVEVHKASGTKCSRCWLYRDDIGQSEKHPEICGRCVVTMD
jgi:isoleucyl-tRNA synthetase